MTVIKSNVPLYRMMSSLLNLIQVFSHESIFFPALPQAPLNRKAHTVDDKAAFDFREPSLTHFSQRLFMIWKEGGAEEGPLALARAAGTKTLSASISL